MTSFSSVRPFLDSFYYTVAIVRLKNSTIFLLARTCWFVRFFPESSSSVSALLNVFSFSLAERFHSKFLTTMACPCEDRLVEEDR